MSQYREPTLKDAMETIARQAIRISQLETDNVALRTEVAVYRKNRPDAHGAASGKTTQVSPTPSGTSTSTEVLTTSKTPDDKYARLSQKNAELRGELSALESKHEDLERKYKRAKQWCQCWKDYAEKQKRRLKSAGCYESEPPPSDGFEQDVVQGNEGGSTQKAVQSSKNSRSTHPTNGPSVMLFNPAPTSSPRTRHHRVTSSQTTVEEPLNQDVALTTEHYAPTSDHQPEFISARPVKRKAAASAMTEPPARRVKIKKEPDSPSAPVEISSDPLTSPGGTPLRRQYTDMSDLDIVGPPIITPRLPIRKKDFAPRELAGEMHRPVPQLSRNQLSLSDSEIMNRQQDSNSGGRAEEPHSTDVLRPLSANVPRMPQPQNIAKTNSSRVRRGTSKHDVALLSEDGDDRASQIAAQRKEPPDGGKPVDLRLDGLLNEHSLEKTPAFLRQPLHGSSTKAKTLRSPHLPTPVSVVKRSSPTKSKSPVKYSRTPRNLPSPVKPDHEPLRIRDPKSLQLGDFKINPKYLGTEFAFADTLRGRDQRRGLHTCTRPNCCGDALRKAVAIGGQSLSGKKDHEALKEFLGDNWEVNFNAYNAEQRQDITLQAHAFCFASKHGKHRQAFEKPSSPPGFWSTDFPTTQETAENLEKAKEMERKTIAERWREAVRGGGRWIFRDE